MFSTPDRHRGSKPPPLRSLALLGMVVSGFTACEDERAESMDAGLAPRDARASLTCVQAVQEFDSLVSTDPLLQELRACADDRDCVRWEPSFECLGGRTRLCSKPTSSASVDRTDARQRELGASVCERLGERCSSAPRCLDTALLCLQGRCAAASVDGGRP